MTSRDEFKDDRAAITVVEETPVVEKHIKSGDTVRVRTIVHQNEVVVDEPTMAETVEIERVRCDQWVDGPQQIRQDGETTVIPILEEVVVIEKRLRLIEEVRITRRQVGHTVPRRVTVRRQEAVVEREPARDDPAGDEFR